MYVETPPRASKRSLAGLRSRFLAVDWSFPSSTPDPAHDLHPYPAKYIGAIPAAAITLAPDEGAILDPFCGVGTTRAGRRAIGVDLNPIATLVTRTKLSGWFADDTALHAQHRLAFVGAARGGDTESLAAARARIPRLDHWFDPLAQWALAGATSYINTLHPDDPWRDRLATALSIIAVRASRQESDTRYAAVDKELTAAAICDGLGRAVDRVASACSALAASVDNAPAPLVVTDDASNIHTTLGGEEVAAAIFSPPYPNAYEYWLYHKYRMYWLGFEPLAVRSREIGARPSYSGSGRLTEDNFADQMALVLGGIRRRLRSDGVVVIVVGDSIIRGRHIHNAAVLDAVADRSGLRLVARTTRTIRRTRRSFNLAVARAQAEHVLLLGPQ